MKVVLVADSLIDEFIEFTPAEEEFEFDYAVKCSLLCVDYVLNTLSKLQSTDDVINQIHHWKEVKEELLIQLEDDDE